MTIDDKIKDEKLQYDIDSEAAKISALSSGTIDKYEYLTGEEILPSNQRQILEQANCAYSPLGKAFEKQTKTIWEQGKKQAEALDVLKPDENKKGIKSVEGLSPKGMRINEIKNEINDTKKLEVRIREKILNVKQIDINVIFNNLKQ